MRSDHRWRLEPTLRFLATLPMLVAFAGILLELLGRALLPGVGNRDRPAWFAAVGSGMIHVLALILLVPLLRAHGVGFHRAFGLGAPGWTWRVARGVGWTLPALAAAWLLHQGSGWVLDLLSINHQSQEAVNAVRSAASGWEQGLLFLFAAISAPVTEEILFRGILWPLARDRGWRISGAITVGFLFAVIHLNLAALVPLWALGIFWIWLYERSGDLLVPITSHALFNALNFAWILWSPPAPPS